jgi:hypothetical protein
MSFLNASSETFDTEKCFVSILWLVDGIHNLLHAPKGTTQHSSSDAAMPSLIENVRSRTRRKTLKGRLTHMDNAYPQNSG